MANYSINQVRHFYVATASGAVTPESANGTLEVKGSADKSTLVFKYKSPGGVEGSDIINVNNIMYAKHTLAANMATTLKVAEVTPLSDAVIVGQEYIVKLTFKNYAGAGDDNYTVKYGMATAKSTNVSDLLKELAISLAKNMKDLLSLATIHLATADSMVEVKASDKMSDLTGTYTALVIEEVEQPWVAGVKAFSVIPFEVSTFPIIKDGVEVNWTEDIVVAAPEADGTVINNGKKIADLEWFHIGARGDMYRGFGHPYGVKTEILADPSVAYDTIDIHYSYVGPNEGVQKSEKTITIAAPAAVATTIKTALGTAGVTVA